MRKLVFIILFLPLGLYAEGLDIDSLLSVRDGLRESIDSMREQESVARHERDLWLDSIAMLHNFSHNVDSLNAGIDPMVKLEEELRQEYEDFIRAREDTKEEVDKVGDELNAMMASLEPYLPAYLNARSSEFITYTERLYSQMDKGTLENYLLEANRCKDRAEMAEAIKRLTFSVATKDLVDSYWHLLEITFDSAAVNNARRYILHTIKGQFENENLITKEQWKEIDILDIYLSRYRSGVTNFKKLLEDLEENNDVKVVFDSQKGNEDRYYNNIPYLRNQYKWIRDSMIDGRNKDEILNSKEYREIRNEIENITTK